LRRAHGILIAVGKAIIFGKTLLDTKCVFCIFCTTFVWHIAHSAKNWARYGTKCTRLFKM